MAARKSKAATRMDALLLQLERSGGKHALAYGEARRAIIAAHVALDGEARSLRSYARDILVALNDATNGLNNALWLADKAAQHGASE